MQHAQLLYPSKSGLCPTLVSNLFIFTPLWFYSTSGFSLNCFPSALVHPIFFPLNFGFQPILVSPNRVFHPTFISSQNLYLFQLGFSLNFGFYQSLFFTQCWFPINFSFYPTLVSPKFWLPS